MMPPLRAEQVATREDIAELWEAVTPLQLWRARMTGFLLALSCVSSAALAIAMLLATAIHR